MLEKKIAFRLMLVIILSAFTPILLSLSFAIFLYGELEIEKRVASFKSSYVDVSKEDVFWAQEIIKGGYILHFRHAEREKWIDVQMYDALESDVVEVSAKATRFAENDYFAKAVCLNERGKIQARAIGEHLSRINLPIGHVASSVSCRARQTAELAFGGYNTLNRLLVHVGPYCEDRSDRLQTLIEFYTKVPLLDYKNTVVSSHNKVIECEMFENCSSKKLRLEEGGFYVISRRNNMLFLEHEFHNFNQFNRVFYVR